MEKSRRGTSYFYRVSLLHVLCKLYVAYTICLNVRQGYRTNYVKVRVLRYKKLERTSGLCVMYITSTVTPLLLQPHYQNGCFMGFCLALKWILIWQCMWRLFLEGHVLLLTAWLCYQKLAYMYCMCVCVCIQSFITFYLLLLGLRNCSAPSLLRGLSATGSSSDLQRCRIGFYR